MKSITTTQKVLNAFNKGRRLSSAQMRAMGATNPSATVHYIRHSYGLTIQHDGKAYRLA